MRLSKNLHSSFRTTQPKIATQNQAMSIRTQQQQAGSRINALGWANFGLNLIATIGQVWMAYKQLELANKQFAFSKEQFNKNFLASLDSVMRKVHDAWIMRKMATGEITAKEALSDEYSFGGSKDNANYGDLSALRDDTRKQLGMNNAKQQSTEQEKLLSYTAPIVDAMKKAVESGDDATMTKLVKSTGATLPKNPEAVVGEVISNNFNPDKFAQKVVETTQTKTQIEEKQNQERFQNDPTQVIQDRVKKTEILNQMAKQANNFVQTKKQLDDFDTIRNKPNSDNEAFMNELNKSSAFKNLQQTNQANNPNTNTNINTTNLFTQQNNQFPGSIYNQQQNENTVDNTVSIFKKQSDNLLNPMPVVNKQKNKVKNSFFNNNQDNNNNNNDEDNDNNKQKINNDNKNNILKDTNDKKKKNNKINSAFAQ